jgi:hypothetical protein
MKATPRDPGLLRRLREAVADDLPIALQLAQLEDAMLVEHARGFGSEPTRVVLAAAYVVYRLRFLRHRIEAYAASAAD